MERMNKVVLVTGALRGIGFATVQELLRRGCRVFLGGRDLPRTEEAAERTGALPLVVDIDSDESVRAAAAQVRAEAGRLDVLINNAAILLDHYNDLANLSPDTLVRTFATNVAGTFRVTKAMLPLLESGESPRVVNVSSGAGQLDGDPQAWAPAYSISKTAVNMLTQQLAVAFPRVIVNSICPGWCRTEMGGSGAPLGAEDGARSIVWLALDAPDTLCGSFVKDRAVIPW